MIHPNYPTALLFSKPLAVFQIPPAGARLLTRAKTNVCSMFALREFATAGTIRSASDRTAPPGRALRGFEASHKGWGFICREQKPPQTWTSWNRVYNFPTSAAAAVQLASVFIALSRTGLLCFYTNSSAKTSPISAAFIILIIIMCIFFIMQKDKSTDTNLRLSGL